MAENSKIEWCDHTFNPWIGCTKVGPGCDNCYAEAMMDKRLQAVTWGVGQERKRTSAANWKLPIKWNAEAARTGTRPRVFCASLADWLDLEVPIAWLVDMLDLIRTTPHLDWLLVSKRIGNWKKRLLQAIEYVAFKIVHFELAQWINEWIRGRAPANVQIGSTICTQPEADRDLPKLYEIPARVRFLSVEPMLGQIDLGDFDHECGDPPHSPCPVMWPDWIICGGESGPHARPMHPDWARSLRDQCAAARVPFFFKQWGEYSPFVNEDHFTYCGEEKPSHAHAWVDSETGDHGLCWIIDDDGLWSNWTGNPRFGAGAEPELHPCIAVMGRVGKKVAGRLLDGREHNEFPAVRA